MGLERDPLVIARCPQQQAFLDDLALQQWGRRSDVDQVDPSAGRGGWET